jgi:hypothetical protein
MHLPSNRGMSRLSVYSDYAMILLYDLNDKGWCILSADYRAFLYTCEGM